MKINIAHLINNLKNNLNENINPEDIIVHTPGISNALIFQIRNDYLYKIYNTLDDYEKSSYFFEYYHTNEYFQHIKYKEDNNKALCLTYHKGNILYGKTGDYSNIIPKLYEIIKTYKEYNHDDIKKYNYKPTKFTDFLKNNINYNYMDIIDINLINSNLEIINKYNYKNYLIHGDFGSHNIIINDNNIKIIDPFVNIADKLYDFYCGIFSDPIIFEKSNIEDILKYFDEYEIEYKKSLLKICFIYRMLIAVKYNYYNNTEIYYDWYNKYINN